MLKASALYLVILVALVIALLCSFIIMAAYFYTSEYQGKIRYDHLQNNLKSGINLLTASTESIYISGQATDLFHTSEDSVYLKRLPWGLYDACAVKAFIQKDTLYNTFLLGNTIDSSKWAAIYLIDQDRPLSVSGKTAISGNVFLPKAGVRPAYVDDKAYEGDKRIVKGNIFVSERSLPALTDKIIKRLEKSFGDTTKAVTGPITDTITRSFLNSTLRIQLGKAPFTLQNLHADGNIILYSDTLVTIDSSASLNHVLVFAKAIVVKSGFHGNCQLFAKDSINIGKNCFFSYPSTLGVLQFKSSMVGFPARMSIGEGSTIEGIVFTYQKEHSGFPVMLSLAKKVKIKGQIYAMETLQCSDDVQIMGGTFAKRFLYQSAFTGYENYLINLTINSDALSAHYLTSELLPVAKTNKKILQWIEVK